MIKFGIYRKKEFKSTLSYDLDPNLGYVPLCSILPKEQLVSTFEALMALKDADSIEKGGILNLCDEYFKESPKFSLIWDNSPYSFDFKRATTNSTHLGKYGLCITDVGYMAEITDNLKFLKFFTKFSFMVKISNILTFKQALLTRQPVDTNLVELWVRKDHVRDSMFVSMLAEHPEYTDKFILVDNFSSMFKNNFSVSSISEIAKLKASLKERILSDVTKFRKSLTTKSVNASKASLLKELRTQGFILDTEIEAALT